ncbi:hypothetical protein EDD63_10525 [Breznakia blatticola]|uniref:Uncharacterized protein n=1 Tax=Breznakia blatticola TaxID=1754012 RepID=A0A4R8A3Y1_9FIRM|nr:hypothetical protein [Breznakia blatticola]TDW25293.1 hypothetical protein EDD63_10525 [Breznakia blatticola]
MKKNRLLLISFVLSVVYIVYEVFYLTGLSPSSNSAEEVGTALGFMLIIPHFVVVIVAVLFNGLALFMNKRAFALTAGILYSVSIVLMPIYFMFVLVQTVFCYIAFAKMKTVPIEKVESQKTLDQRNSIPLVEVHKTEKDVNDEKPYIVILSCIILGLCIVVLLLLYCVYTLTK